MSGRIVRTITNPGKLKALNWELEPLVEAPCVNGSWRGLDSNATAIIESESVFCGEQRIKLSRPSVAMRETSAVDAREKLSQYAYLCNQHATVRTMALVKASIFDQSPSIVII